MHVATATEENLFNRGEALGRLEGLTLDRHRQVHAPLKAEAETDCLTGGTILGRLALGTTHLTSDNPTVSLNKIRSTKMAKFLGISVEYHITYITFC
jgi:hypothetical protein